MLWKELIYNYVKNNKKTIMSYIIVVFLTFPVESVALPQMYSKLFESIRIKGQLPGIFENIIENIRRVSSTGIIWYIIFTWCFVVFFYNVKNKYEAKISPEYLSFVRQKIFSKTLINHSTNFSELRVGEHITRILDVSRNMRDILNFILTDIFPLLVAIVFIIGYFLYVNHKIGCVMLIGILITMLTMYFMGNKCIEKSAEREKYYLQMSEKLSDSFGNLMNVYLNNETEKEIKKNDEIDLKHTESFKKQLILTKDMIAILSIISVLTFIVVLIMAYNILRNKQISGAYFVSIVIILIYYLGYLIKVSNNIPWFLNRLGIVKNSELFLENILKTKVSKNKNNQITKGSIYFKNVSFKYPGSEDYILKNVSVNFEENNKIGIIGPSGSGKSTIMKLLLRMNKIQQGEILVDGINIDNININHLRKKIIYINQKTSLFNTSILENILYGNPQITEKDVIQIIQKYNLSTIYQELKKGIYEDAGVSGANLSLGMQKVTILLRGIFKEGKIVIFDEPLAGLDSSTRMKVIKMIKGECKNKTVLIITHDKEIIPYCDKVLNITDIKNNRLNS